MKKQLELVTPEQEQNLRKSGFDWRDETPTVALALKWFGKMRKIYYEIKLIQFNHNEREPGFPLEPKIVYDINQFDDKSEIFYSGNIYAPYGYPKIAGIPTHIIKDDLERELLHFSLINGGSFIC